MSLGEQKNTDTKDMLMKNGPLQRMQRSVFVSYSPYSLRFFSTSSIILR